MLDGMWLLMVMMMKTMMSDATTALNVTAHSGDAVLLTAGLQEAGLGRRWDFRWTHTRLVMSSKNNVTTCRHGRCELLRNGSLRFSRVQLEDAGSYHLQVFNDSGHLQMATYFLLSVQAGRSSGGQVSGLVFGFPLFLFFFIIIFFMVKRRKSHVIRPAGALEENLYVVMHSNHGNTGKGEEGEKQEREEDSLYVPCNPVVSVETPITQQVAEDVEDIYM